MRTCKVIKMFNFFFFNDCFSTFNYDIKDVMSLDLVQIAICNPRSIFMSKYEMVKCAFHK